MSQVHDHCGAAAPWSVHINTAAHTLDEPGHLSTHLHHSLPVKADELISRSSKSSLDSLEGTNAPSVPPHVEFEPVELAMAVSPDVAEPQRVFISSFGMYDSFSASNSIYFRNFSKL
jgi:hypothetical protein